MRNVWLPALLALVCGSANAALQSRLSGQAYYDTVLDITWIADANLADSSNFGVGGITSSGLMTWNTANLWIAALNSSSYLGASDWRLPATPQPDASCAQQDGSGNGFGVGCAGSEMGHMYFIDGISSSTPAPFSNVQAGVSWSAQQYPPNTLSAWSFRGDGFQSSQDKNSLSYAWAVRDGDIDADGDAFGEGVDNCTLVPNPTQLDTDGDGYGNICDADLNNSGTVTTADFGLLRSVLGQPVSFSPLAAAADLNGSGTVTTADFGILRARLGTAPGPSKINLKYRVTVFKTGTGVGTVSASPSGISCGSFCESNYNVNSVITLTATPNPGSTFTGWSAPCGGSGVCILTMSAARTVTANFTLNTYPLSVSVVGSGTVTSVPAGISCGSDCNETYDYNTVVTLTPAGLPGWIFTGWAGACAGTGSCVLAMTAFRTVSATFTLLNANPLCPSNEFLGSISGDTGTGTLTTNGVGEKWLRVFLTEDSNQFLETRRLSATVTLTSPSGGDYDLYVYCLSCGGVLAGSSTNNGSVTDIVPVRREDTLGPDDSFSILIEVRYFTGTTSNPWSLQIQGNSTVSAATCPASPFP